MADEVVIKFTGVNAGLSQTIDRATGDFGKLGQQLEKSSKSAGLLGESLKGIATGAGIAAFGVLQGALGSIPGAVAKNTLQFEKFNTVLTTLYGDAGKAKDAFAGIQQFAATTPFELSEVTDSFIKLKNRGIDPTKETLTSLGDLAASQGKSLNQVTEAVLDAQTNSFERLKEFGIQASSVGDQVTFTFKGVTQTVAKTPEAIQGAILKLGELKGVAGGMEAQSKTLGGQLSNLQDAAAKISVAFGNELIPVLQEFVGALNSGGGSAEQFARELGQGTADNLRLLGSALKFVKDNAAPLQLALEVLLLRFAALRAIALIGTLQQTAAGLLATGAAGGVAAGGIGAMATAAAIAAGPLVLLTAAVAATQFIKLGQDLRIANESLDALGNGANASGDAAILLANKTKNLNAEIEKTGKATDAQKQKAQQLIALNKEQVKALEDQLAQVQAVQPANEEQANAQKALEANLQASIKALKGQTTALEGNVAGKKANTAATKDSKEALKEEADALKLKRDSEKEEKTDAFADQQLGRDRQRQDDKANREQQLNQQVEQLQTESQKRVEDLQTASQTRLAESQKRLDGGIQKLREDGQTKIQQAQEAFSQSQKAQLEQFLGELEARKQTLQQGFDTEKSAANQKIDRQLQTEAAKTPEDQAKLQKQFAEEDAKAKRKAALEAQYLQPILDREAAAKKLLQTEEDTFRAAQEQKKVEFEKTITDQRQQLETDLDAFKKAGEKQIADQKKLDEAAITNQKKIDEVAIQKLKEEAAKKEQGFDRDFEDQRRAAERTFKKEMRDYDLETARQVKAIAESTKSPTATTPKEGVTPKAKVAARRLGGAVDAGSLYQVGEAGPEYFVPSDNGYVIRHEEAIALARDALGSRSLAPSVVMAPTASNDALLSELRQLRRTVESREPQIQVPVTFEGQKAEGNSDQFWRLQRAMYRGMM